MLNATLIAISEMDEYEVTLEINGIRLLCFAVVCPYKTIIQNNYLVDLSLNVSDEVEPNKIENETYSIEKKGSGYGYILRGKLLGNTLDLNFFSIQDDYLGQFPRLNGRFVEIEVQGIWVTFLE